MLHGVNFNLNPLCHSELVPLWRPVSNVSDLLWLLQFTRPPSAASHPIDREPAAVRWCSSDRFSDAIWPTSSAQPAGGHTDASCCDAIVSGWNRWWWWRRWSGIVTDSIQWFQSERWPVRQSTLDSPQHSVRHQRQWPLLHWASG